MCHPNEQIREVLEQVDFKRMTAKLFSLSKAPLPCRRANFALPGHEESTLAEADGFICVRLESWGYDVLKEPVQVQAYRRDTTKHPQAQYSPPMPGDPWYTVHNLYATKNGSAVPDEIILAVAHKDSQSWIDSPGALERPAPGDNDGSFVTAGFPAAVMNIGCNPSTADPNYHTVDDRPNSWTSTTQP